MNRPIRLSRSSSSVSDNENGIDMDETVLRKVNNWACVKGCGACCKLGPIESRPDLDDYLTADQLALYKSMIGSDDWCKHFDKEKRMCTIYDERPVFCQVGVSNFIEMYDIKESEFDNFCSFCCREQISDVYGEESKEMDTFETVLEQIEIADFIANDVDDEESDGEETVGGGGGGFAK